MHITKIIRNQLNAGRTLTDFDPNVQVRQQVLNRG